MPLQKKARDTLWHLVDARGQTVGRLATGIARALMGKQRPTYEPRDEGNDVVVVVNADKVSFTGRKWEQKKYYRHSGHPGGLKVKTAAQIRDTKPLKEGVLYRAVAGMLPKNRLRTGRMRRLRLYAGAQHPHLDVLPEVRDEDGAAEKVDFGEFEDTEEAPEDAEWAAKQPRRLVRPNRRSGRKGRAATGELRVTTMDDLEQAKK